MDFNMEYRYINYAKLIQDTKLLRESLDAIYPEDMSLTIKRIHAIHDGIISSEESELLRQYIIVAGG